MLTKNYTPTITAVHIERHWPNLKDGENFHFTSMATEDYNCVAWASGMNDIWIQFKRDGFYLTQTDRFIEFFEKIGFELTDNPHIENGFQKIAIYTEGIEFRHVALQLPSGRWTSKLGDWEDIEHYTLEALAGKSYGNPTFFLKKAL